jgi:hypothetical protein
MAMTDWQKQAEQQQIAREKRLKELKASVLKLWGELDVKEVHFVFSCGGDSMGDTHIDVYNSNDDLLESENVRDIENYFDDVIYDNVHFYENSDGHYMGEDGKVVIMLDEDDNTEFTYDKESQEEWCEHTPFTEVINLTDEEVEFIDKYVSDINGNMSENDIFINYKIDFLQTDELIALEEKLLEKIKNFFYNYEPELENMSDWHTMEINAETLNKKTKTIDIEMSFEHYVYRYSED